MNRSLVLFVGLSAVLASPLELLAHGGRYRGAFPAGLPGVKRPASGAPTTPPAPVPVTPPFGGAVPASPTTPRRGPGTGVSLAPDLTTWQIWWEFNKDRFLLLKDAIHQGQAVTGSDAWYMGPSRRRGKPMGLAPNDHQRRNVILPALRRALRRSDNQDLVTACLIAMAKVGMDHAEFKLLPELKGHLRSRRQDVRETAALALGISKRPEALGLLRDLLADNGAGRRLSGNRSVNDRTRAFAAYALGILAGSAPVEMKSQIAEVLFVWLEDHKAGHRDIRIAVVNALGVLRTDPAKARARLLMWRTLKKLWTYYQQKLGKGEQYAQCHVPIAVARLLGRGTTTEHMRYKKALVAELGGRKRKNPVIYQSAVIALGLLVDPEHADDSAYSKALWDYYVKGRDQQARYFALMAMATIGGNSNRQLLLGVLARGKKTQERPWAGLALGVLTHAARKRESSLRDATVGDALLGQLLKNKNRSSQGAYAVALGLCGSKDAAAELRTMLVKHRDHDEFAGYLAIGLALMDDQNAVAVLREIADGAVRRPDLLRQVAIAMGKLRDKSATNQLLKLIQDRDANTARMAAVATGLGYIGDRRTVKPLVEHLQNDNLTKLSRAFIAAALGSIADRAPLPFGSRYASHGNYRASVQTLTNSAGTGILDLL